MASPTVHSDIYRKYKQGTNFVVSWLLDNSGGTTVANLQAGSIVNPTAKAKRAGKNKDKNKENGTKLQTSAVVIASASLPRLAQAFVKRKIEVPSYVLQVLRSVIAGRWQCAKLFAGAIPDDNHFAEALQSNSGHVHFVRVLQTVYDVLKGAAVIDTPTTYSKQTTTNGLPDSNVFAALPVEEPVEWTTDPMKFVPSEASVNTSCKLDNTEEETLEEELFAVFALYMDYRKVRFHIHEIWRAYARNAVSLVTATVTTYVAFEVIQRLCYDMQQSLRVVDVKLICHKLHLAEAEINKGQFVLGQASYPTIFNLISEYSTTRFNIRDGTLPFPRQYTAMNWSTDYKNEKCRWSDDSALLQRAFPDMMIFLAAGLKGSRQSDCISSAITTLAIKKLNVSLWLVLASAIFLDLHHILLDQIDRPWSELQRTSHQFQATVKKHKQFLALNGIDGSNLASTKGMYNTSDTLRNIIDKDVVGDWHIKGFREANKLEEVIPGLPMFWIGEDGLPTEYYILKHHPLLAGQLEFGLRIRAYSIGLTLNKEFHSWTAMAHLHNAATVSGLLPAKWPDLETVLSVYTDKEVFFTTTRPTTTKAFRTTYALSRGIKSKEITAEKTWDSDAVIIAIPGSQSSNRGLLDVKTALCKIICEAMDNKGRDVLLHNIENLMMEHYPEHTSVSMVTTKSKQWSAQHVFSPIELLVAVRHAIEGEEPLLDFDHIGFHWICQTVLRQLKSKLTRLAIKGNRSDGKTELLPISDEPLWLSLVVESVFRSMEWGTNLGLKAAVAVLEKMLLDEKKGNKCAGRFGKIDEAQVD